MRKLRNLSSGKRSDCAGAIRQAVKMALVARRVRLGDIADVAASWEPLRERQTEPASHAARSSK
ncbi:MULTISPECIES: hypothetical protein [Rhizobium]|uniref:hypothetical protein n=1 Tax=Rhizobium TaxID=379 RepID=UPI0010325FA2|nr:MULTISPECIES: hypothetical protein [Rhizobium]MBA1343948.1 hypothetical protein [Rhizobium sp. WYCCWR 11146]TBF89201.1 hypothetical protein ELG82_37280 [Rhizobium leguminosarum]